MLSSKTNPLRVRKPLKNISRTKLWTCAGLCLARWDRISRTSSWKTDQAMTAEHPRTKRAVRPCRETVRRPAMPRRLDSQRLPALGFGYHDLAHHRDHLPLGMLDTEQRANRGFPKGGRALVIRSQSFSRPSRRPRSALILRRSSILRWSRIAFISYPNPTISR